MSSARPVADMKRQFWLVVGFWLVVAAAKIWFARASIADWIFPDPDDAMRLMQVRDWLAGQSWFDVTQYRLNLPTGAPMHWSRMVDLPIAAVILLTRPILGQHGAETAALIAVPMLTLLIAMLLVHRIARRLIDGPAAMLAVIATPFSLGAVTQMQVLRIDHHGWQIVLALAAVLAVLDKRARRSAVGGGAAMALWLTISIEGLPFAVAIGAWFALDWLRNPNATARLKDYVASLAVLSVLLFVLTHAPASWSSYPHDAINGAHLAAFVVAALGCQVAVRQKFRDPRLRIGVLALIGIAAIGAMFAFDPHALQAPFAALDPVVKNLWYDAVQEGQPVWKLSFGEAGAALAQPLVGLGGALLAIWKTSPDRRSAWITYLWLLAAATIASICVVREATMASMLSLPGTAFLCEFALLRARKLSVMPTRALATAGALCIMGPAYALPPSVAPAKPDSIESSKAAETCVRRSEIEKLRALPTSRLAVPMDITPAILASTPHSAIASGHHRNVAGIRDVILLFVRPPAQGRAILARRRIDYLVFCPRTPESLWWASQGHDGLSAMLNAGRAPDWLEPVHIAGLNSLRVWRVRKDLIAAAGA